LPLEAAFSQFAASFSTIMNDKESAASALDKKNLRIGKVEKQNQQ
jgi:hypothetical protein